MIHGTQRCIFLLAAWFYSLAVLAQAPVINVNSSIKVIKGEAYYIHTVLEGQQVEDIAAAYYTQVSEILRANPEIRTGLVTGMKLKIPYSDASLEAMGKAAASAPAPAPKAAAPVEEPAKPVKKESPPAETKAEPATLEALSKNVNESLENLEKIRESLEQLPEPEPEKVAPAEPQKQVEILTRQLAAEPLESPRPARSSGSVSGLLDQYELRFFAGHPDDSIFYLKEYFFADIDAQGRIVTVEDQRTVTNKNTLFIGLAELSGLTLDNYRPAGPQEKVALGAETEVRRYPYRVKIKRKKVRVYRSPMFVEYLPKDHPHAVAILKAAQEAGVRGKADLIVYAGVKKINLYQPFEYNPFGTVRQTLVEQPILRVTGLESGE